MKGWVEIERNTRTTGRLDSGCSSVELPRHCTLAEIGALHDLLRSVSRTDNLDGSQVERIDSAGLRLLVAFIRERRAAGYAIGWRAASSVLNRAVWLTGLTAAINLPEMRDTASR
jgi:ABC-type transporter Mla MlaB component